MEERLFQSVDFISHSGLPLTWKIECDAIHDDEWSTLAKMIREYENKNWRKAIGIPRGGVKLGEELNKYSSNNPDDPILICDDVYTTGKSFADFVSENFDENEKIFCWCVFARKPTENGIKALFTMPEKKS
jgi:basic membrane lipoprotein Med (substrate-binding protein (PBP1-ABC) superfamily)